MKNLAWCVFDMTHPLKSFWYAMTGRRDLNSSQLCRKEICIPILIDKNLLQTWQLLTRGTVHIRL
jgi:hypothetical protein